MNRNKLFLIIAFTQVSIAHAQRSTATDGEWSKQYVVLKNTAEADLMIRVGDIDNLSHGWAENFNPFSGRSTDSHGYPWETAADDAWGTDRIMIPSGYRYGSDASTDGYTGYTQRPGNSPMAIMMPLKETGNIDIKSATFQIFIDDFQAAEFQKKFQVKINGLRFVEAEKIINSVNQTGPIGKLVSIRLTDEFLSMLKSDSLLIFIDDPITAGGDGYAIDFVKLLINPKAPMYKGIIRGKVIDEATKKPIANALTEVKEYGSATTAANGEFQIRDVPAGLDIVSASAPGYSSAQLQIDVIEGETTEEVVLELKRSGKMSFNNKTLQEGDKMIMNNIQFEVSSATLLAGGKTELDKLATLMKQNDQLEILLTGYTSSEGAAATNKQLSLRRVRACKDYLISNGIDEGRITIRGLGPDSPVAPNDTEANRAKNRRVELKVTRV